MEKQKVSRTLCRNSTPKSPRGAAAPQAPSAATEQETAPEVAAPATVPARLPAAYFWRELAAATVSRAEGGYALRAKAGGEGLARARLMVQVLGFRVWGEGCVVLGVK